MNPAVCSHISSDQFHTHTQSHRAERGAALVELAIVIMLLVGLFSGLITVCKTLSTLAAVSRASYQGALTGGETAYSAGDVEADSTVAGLLDLQHSLGFSQPNIASTFDFDEDDRTVTVRVDSALFSVGGYTPASLAVELTGPILADPGMPTDLSVFAGDPSCPEGYGDCGECGTDLCAVSGPPPGGGVFIPPPTLGGCVTHGDSCGGTPNDELIPSTAVIDAGFISESDLVAYFGEGDLDYGLPTQGGFPGGVTVPGSPMPSIPSGDGSMPVSTGSGSPHSGSPHGPQPGLDSSLN